MFVISEKIIVQKDRKLLISPENSNIGPLVLYKQFTDNVRSRSVTWEGFPELIVVKDKQIKDLCRRTE